ncbi:Aldedh-domain-containing protein [Pseudovirgaria hyperparasitica]|uniref:aldehyde dehydrogenase (NAD(+)) n=1 Tax=Pseudovirgaria hyperparasitica TaxID=470096 RepID=A0A6A6VT80_9PEZI|nr:Aldedh-domain-containing protein [Pseudovirgaria hyperparasitica]KAF2753355.1 Aldedh-domain-containing protein [Pseudovirgaria hyperparasitica]
MDVLTALASRVNDTDVSTLLHLAAPALVTGFALLVVVVVVRRWSQAAAEAGVRYSVPVPEQAREGWKGDVLEKPGIKVYVVRADKGGEKGRSRDWQVEGSEAIQCYCPANGRLLGRIEPDTRADIDRAVERAEAAQREWRTTTFAQRRRVLRSMLRFLLDNQDTLATVACLDSGKTRIDALFGEILVTAEKLKWVIDHGERALRPERRPTNFLMFYKKNEVRWEPLGVVAACVSWNYPFHNLISPVISSLFAGNAIVVKGSEQTAWSSAYFASVAKHALIACGHSPELVQSVTCWPDVAPHLTSHPGIAHITFIGSRPVAFHVAASAASALIPTVIELGGKDPAIVLDDAAPDLSRIIPILMRGTFQSAGQNCIGIERIIAQPAIHDKILSAVLPLIKSLNQGSALDNPPSAPAIDLGASISPSSFPALQALIAEAIADGATLHTGGNPYSHPSHPKGHYFAPTLLSNVTPSMRIARTELFAPVMLLLRAPTPAAALAAANATPYALGASIFGRCPRVLADLTDGISAGMVSVNDFAAYYAVQLPFGGVRGSGYGRFAGAEGLRGVCNVKSVCVDRWPSVLRTAIPSVLGMPGGAGAARMWEFGKGVVEVGYGESLGRRVRGVRRFLGV